MSILIVLIIIIICLMHITTTYYGNALAIFCRLILMPSTYFELPSEEIGQGSSQIKTKVSP
ncbi:hypothetical protein CBW53_03785 [Yersinia frederiksenii]|nr:hypothetical protein CBW53_03785 [Yersinia frederiksenii]